MVPWRDTRPWSSLCAAAAGDAELAILYGSFVLTLKFILRDSILTSLAELQVVPECFSAPDSAHTTRTASRRWRGCVEWGQLFWSQYSREVLTAAQWCSGRHSGRF